ncbi:MAG: alpha/beta fold hydrolase [Planctomycetaceae bacterium]|nr:alpha/beta fold hydrolase [Planctomycetaceae bacterium]
MTAFYKNLMQTVLAAALCSATAAQEFRSPEVHEDGSVTVRLRSRTAKQIRVSIAGQTLDLVKGEGDVWAATTDPLSAGIHDYSFNLDGTRIIDPSNRRVKKWFTLASMVEIPGTPPLLTEQTDVPHGVVQRLSYASESTGNARPVVVYTPPDYHQSDSEYPLVLLLHGFGDDETAWTEVGRAHLIADNLIARQMIRPCVIAMPYGHPIPPPFGKRSERPANYFQDNNERYEADIVKDLLPFLKSRFRVTDDAQQRSIVGLSMGGGHAIHVGLRHVNLFGAVGAFSAAAPQGDTAELLKRYPSLAGDTPAANSLQHFWIPIGKDDFLLNRNRAFIGVLNEQNVQHRYIETDGAHSWYVWRKYLPEFLQMVAPATSARPSP